MMLLLPLLLASTAPAYQQRCGWIQNPTPANWWLVDRDGEWTISMQGGYQAPGWEDLPPMGARQWVRTNGSYGYGCGCASVRVDRRTSRVTAIRSMVARPLKVCRADRRLPRP